MRSNLLLWRPLVSLLVLIVLSTTSLMFPKVVRAETFPPQSNGIQITYTVTGATLDSPSDSLGISPRRTYNGRLTGSKLVVSGQVTINTGASMGASLLVTASAGSSEARNEAKPFNADTNTTSGPDRDFGKNPWIQNFSVEVDVPKNARDGSFDILLKSRNLQGGETYKVFGMLEGARQDPTATVSPTIDLKIDHVEAVQVVQTADNSVPLVAGKTTLLRVFVVAVGNVQGPLAGLTGVTLNGGFTPEGAKQSTVVNPANTPYTVPFNPDRNNLNDSINIYLPKDVTKGKCQVHLEVKPPETVRDTNYENNTKDFVLDFLPTNRYNIGYVRVSVQLPGHAAVSPTNDISNHIDLLRKVYPLADDGVAYYDLGTPFTLKTNLSTIQQEMDFIQGLAKYYEMMAGDKKPDQLFAWLPDGGAWNTGFSDPLKSDVGPNMFRMLGDAPKTGGRVVYGVDMAGRPDWSQVTVVHEIGHNLGLRHTNIAADGTNTVFNNCGAMAPDSGTYWKFPNSEIQDLGFEFAGNGGKIRPKTDFDMMSYCYGKAGNPTWISPLHYKMLIESKMGPRPFQEANPAPQPGGASFGNNVFGVLAGSAAAKQEYLIVSGSVRRDGSSGTLDPMYRSADFDPGDPWPSTGSQCVRVSAVSGAVVNYCFELTFVNHRTGQPVDQQDYELKVPVPSDLAAVALYRGTKELAVVKPSASPPSLSVDAPKAGDKWDGSRTLSWTGRSADGGPLTYAVLYTPDGGKNWLPLGLDQTEPQLTIDTSALANSDKVYFRVYATSGINTAKAELGPIRIDNKKSSTTSVALPGYALPLLGGTGCLGLMVLVGGVGFLAWRKRNELTTGYPNDPLAAQTTHSPRFCGYCGTPLSQEGRFCGHCGHQIGA